MKQEILCPECTEEMKKIIGDGYKGEYTRFLPGRALREFHCDFCGRVIEPLSPCTAYSVWTDDVPYLPGWELNYIIAKEE